MILIILIDGNFRNVVIILFVLIIHEEIIFRSLRRTHINLRMTLVIEPFEIIVFGFHHVGLVVVMLIAVQITLFV